MKNVFSLLFLISYCSIGLCQTTASDKVRAKYNAFFIYRFAGLTTWPSPFDTLHINVWNDSLLLDELSRIAKTKPIHGKPVHVNFLSYNTPLSEVANCHLLFIRNSIPALYGKDVLKAISTQPILLVSTGLDLNSTMISFLEISGQIKFQINEALIREHGLLIDNDLVEMSTDIRAAKDWNLLLNQLGVQKDSTKFFEESNSELKTNISNLTQEINNQQAELKYNTELLTQQKSLIDSANLELLVVEDKMNGALKLLENQKLISYVVALVASIILILGTLAYFNYRKQKNQARIIAHQKKEVELNRDAIELQRIMLAHEKKKSDELLLNILPAEVAEELKEKGSAEAKLIQEATVLFTDFKGFTDLSEKYSPQNLVTEMNACFSAFDAIMEKYGIEKIKTIGDAYMAAGGLLVSSKDAVKNTVLAALEMQQFIGSKYSTSHARELPAFEMRVGIHTGPVVAGIVGVKKFQYDIWGDTVNTASRMESSGEVDKVNISESTYNLLKDDPDFTFEKRGKIEAKGKGELEMWFVNKFD